jgi:RNA ligase
LYNSKISQETHGPADTSIAKELSVTGSFDIEAIEDQIQGGFLFRRDHPSADLHIYNYTSRTQYENHWTPETEACRGLILDSQGNVHGRPFSKFFNYNDPVVKVELPDEPFEVYDKLDGCLGISYFLNGHIHLATRGHFITPQAIHATEVVRQRYGDYPFDPVLTYLFEIIYPGSRIVLDYGDMDDVVLLGLIETATGRELPLPDPAEIPFPVVSRRPDIQTVEQLLALDWTGQEGFVVRFASGMRFKIKFKEYAELHHRATRTNPHDIWEYLRDDKPLDALLDQMPDEFYAWVRKTEAELKAQFQRIETIARQELRTGFATRREAATYIGQCNYPAVTFKMLDGADYRPKIWRLLEPKNNQPFRLDLG